MMVSKAACIIPTHGRPDHLSHSLASVLQQTLPPAEVIVVDDLDDAHTAAVVETVSRQATVPVRHVVNRLQPGVSGSRNAGAAASREQFVAFLDDDDVWRPEHLARAMAELERTGTDAVVSGLCRIKHDGHMQNYVMPFREEAEKQLFDRMVGMTGSNLVIRRATFAQLGGFDPALPVFNDLDLLIRMIHSGLEYCVVPEVTVEWREHAGDRISSPTLRRAIGIELFVAKHRASMPFAIQQKLVATALGIRRRNARSVVEWLKLAVRLLKVLGVREALRRRLLLGKRPAIHAVDNADNSGDAFAR